MQSPPTGPHGTTAPGGKHTPPDTPVDVERQAQVTAAEALRVWPRCRETWIVVLAVQRDDTISSFWFWACASPSAFRFWAKLPAAGRYADSSVRRLLCHG